MPPARDLATSLVLACLEQGGETGLGMLEHLLIHRLFPSMSGEEAVLEKLLEEGKKDLCVAYAMGEAGVVPPLDPDMLTSRHHRRARAAKPRTVAIRFLGQRFAKEGNFDDLRALVGESRPINLFVPALKELVARSELGLTAELLQKLDYSKDQEQLWSEVLLDTSVQLVKNGGAEEVAAVLDKVSASVAPAVRWKPVLPEGYFSKASQRMGSKENMERWLYTPVLSTLVKKGLVAQGKLLFDRVTDEDTPQILSKGLNAFQLISEGRLEEAAAAVEEVRALGGEDALRELRQANRQRLPAFRFGDLLSPLLELALEKDNCEQAMAVFDEMVQNKFNLFASSKLLVSRFAADGKYDDAIAVLHTLFTAQKFNATNALLVCQQANKNGVSQEEYEALKAKMASLGVSNDRWPAWQPPTE